MLSAERHQRILDLLRHQRAASIAELSAALGASPSTVTRDLGQLASEGLVHRVRGGASLASGLAADTPAKIEMLRNVREKEAIAEAAAALIEPGDVIFLESSTTVLAVARLLRTLKPLTVVTNDIFIAAEFADSADVETIVTGGTFRRSTRALIGPATAAMLTSIHVDKVVMGISAISVDHGLTTGSMAEAEIKRLLLGCGDLVIGVADHSKFGRVAFSLVAPAGELDVLITDDAAPEEDVARLEQMGTDVIRVTPFPVGGRQRRSER